MGEPQPKAIHLKDYAPPAFRVDAIELDIDIREDHALVRAKLEVGVVERTPARVRADCGNADVPAGRLPTA